MSNPVRAPWRPLKNDLRDRRVESSILVAVVLSSLLLVFWLAGVAFGYGTILIAYAATRILLARKASRLPRRHGSLLAGIASWPPPPGTFPVHITYRYGIDGIAVDEALVAFGDGWMTVEGLRSSYSVRKDDLYVLHRDGGGCDLLLDEWERVEIRPFEVLSVEGESVRSLRNRFEIALEQWLEDAKPDGAPIMPPVYPRNDWLMMRTAILGYGGGASMLIGYIMLTQTVLHHALQPCWAVLFAAGLACLTQAASRFRKERALRRTLPLSFRGRSIAACHDHTRWK